MDMIIKNGTVVTATGMFKADVAVENGKITAIGSELGGDDTTKVVDASVRSTHIHILQCRSAAQFLPMIILPAQEQLPAAEQQQYLILHCRISMKQ